MNHHHARAALVVAALAATGIAGCGSGDTTTTQPAAQVTETATQTATATAPRTASETPQGQREAAVPGEKATLKTGDVGLKVKVTKVADPVVAYVDRAGPGNKLVGVFIEGQAVGIAEPTRDTSITSLETTDGKVTGVRVIADGDCGGGFSSNDLLLAVKPAKGCIGFEIPRRATPKAITIVLTTPDGQQQATWKLPKAR